MAFELLTLSFSGEPNTSLQVGDIVYYSPTVLDAGFKTAKTFDVRAFAKVAGIAHDPLDTFPTSVDVLYDNSYEPTLQPPSITDYIMFGKNKVVNSSSLIGYYAEVKFVNDSTGDIELFSVASEVSQSSK